MLRRNFDLVCSVCCEAGDVRQTNQDSTLALSGQIADHGVGLYLVADGCGGMAFGDKISMLLVDSFRLVWRQALPQFLAKGSLRPEHILDSLIGWTQQINSTAFAFGQSVNARVGSTLSLLLLVDGSFYILNVGDSRIYLYRRGEFSQLSQDQSLLADMLRNKEISKEEAEHFVRRNVLTMCVGYFEQVQSFCLWGKLKKEDIFLLCSDGLYVALNAELLAQSLPARVQTGSAQELRALISPGRAYDNVSALLVQAL